MYTLNSLVEEVTNLTGKKPRSLKAARHYLAEIFLHGPEVRCSDFIDHPLIETSNGYESDGVEYWNDLHQIGEDEFWVTTCYDGETLASPY